MAGTSSSVLSFESNKVDKRNMTYFGMGMPGSLNYRGLTAIREKVGEDFLVKANQSSNEFCMFNSYNNPSKGGDCTKLWEKNSYLGSL